MYYRLVRFIAACLPVLLGLGLIYLHAIERIGALVAVAATLTIAVLMVLVAACRDLQREPHHRAERS